MSDQTDPPVNEPGWWVAAKVAAFVIIPFFVFYLIKILIE